MTKLRASGWVTAAALLFTVFLAGVLGGAAVTELRTAEPELRGGRGPGGGPGRFGGGGSRADGRSGRGGPQGMGGARVPLLPPGVLEQLGLSDAQRASVDDVLEHRRSETEALLESLYPRLRAQVDSANAEIRGLLTPEQQETFDRIHEQMRERRGPGDREGPRPDGPTPTRELAPPGD